MTEPRVLPHDWFPLPLPANVTIGARSWLYSAMAFMRYRSCRPSGVTIGTDSGLYKGTYFDLGPEGEVRIGDYCALVGVIIASNGCVEIGNYTFISHQVVLADGFAAIPHGEVAATCGTGITIHENVWIGTRVVVLGGVRIGEGAIIGAGTVVDSDVPPYAILAGNPARVVGWAEPKNAETPDMAPRQTR
jgi:acetyltransferase-like isoleucine patch superfamily enzyme